ncbi:hypothetical protein SEMRO_40_G024820.1 [Seminavis robusta]|uniref:Uncharacterized protein n=1 Tax=Seminavis robusta TaxID=568900 RepID=A0A9N8H6B6_9STRA|nr:hypothetical protein SEMRO_40_G024820.1 [Seminavis robusta]|eukprot:Sro40_g024820.1 n/a (490) ;mRNA; f:108773-110242
MLVPHSHIGQDKISEYRSDKRHATAEFSTNFALGDAFDYAVEQLGVRGALSTVTISDGNPKNNLQLLPGFSFINVGDLNHQSDDRQYLPLHPSTSTTGSKMSIPKNLVKDHCSDDSFSAFLARVFFLICISFGIEKEMCPFLIQLPTVQETNDSLLKRGNIGTKQRNLRSMRWIPNQNWHMYVDEETLLAAGAQPKLSPQPNHSSTNLLSNKPSHQIVHYDAPNLREAMNDPNHELYQNQENALTLPGSVIIPILQDQSRRIYIRGPNNSLDIQYNKALFFDGALYHGGWTYKWDEVVVTDAGGGTMRRMWKPAYHAHIESIYLQREKQYLGLAVREALVKQEVVPEGHHVSKLKEPHIITDELEYQSAVAASILLAETKKLKADYSNMGIAKQVMYAAINPDERHLPERMKLSIQKIPELSQGENSSVLGNSIHLMRKSLAIMQETSRGICPPQDKVILNDLMKTMESYASQCSAAVEKDSSNHPKKT